MSFISLSIKKGVLNGSVVQVSRYGSSATLELDGGEGRRYNESFTFDGHQWLLVDKQEGVYAGGKAEYTGVRTFEVYADYQKGDCLLIISVCSIYYTQFLKLFQFFFTEIIQLEFMLGDG